MREVLHRGTGLGEQAFQAPLNVGIISYHAKILDALILAARIFDWVSSPLAVLGNRQYVAIFQAFFPIAHVGLFPRKTAPS